MKRLALTASLVVLVFCLGCPQAEERAENVAETATDMVDKTTDAAEAAMPVALVGTTGCGHCTFEKGSSCSAALKTADGKIYLLDGIDHESDFFKNRQDEMQVKVMGTVSKGDDGEMHVAVASHEMM